jgi:hypothetical protein
MLDFRCTTSMEDLPNVGHDSSHCFSRSYSTGTVISLGGSDLAAVSHDI